jgi:hypothetical protein
VNTQFTPDLSHINRLAIVGKGRIARDHEQAAIARQRDDDVLDQPIDELLLFGIAAHVLEGQHGDGRLVREEQWFWRCGRT